MDKFYDDYFEVLTTPGEGNDELRTIIFKARQNAEFLLKHPVISEFPAEDAKFIAYSLGMALELIQRYENWKEEH